jgi:hypothetical protein
MDFSALPMRLSRRAHVTFPHIASGANQSRASCKMLGFHGGDYEVCSLRGCDTVRFL